MFAALFFLQVYILLAMRKPQAAIDAFMQQRRGVDPYPAFMSVKIRRLQKWCLVFLCLLSVLCARTSSLKAQEENLRAQEEQCMGYFTQILETQKMRQMLQHGANEMMKRYERGNLTKKELDNTLLVWHNTESRLRERVTNIYDIAYTEKCFDRIK
jgi:hypothetical protein